MRRRVVAQINRAGRAAGRLGVEKGIIRACTTPNAGLLTAEANHVIARPCHDIATPEFSMILLKEKPFLLYEYWSTFYPNTDTLKTSRIAEYSEYEYEYSDRSIKKRR
jgi:hypothetical protein